MDLTGIIQIGTIVNTHGVKGELKVLPLTDNPGIFHDLERLIILQGEERRVYSLMGAREINKFWLLKFKEVTDMSAAEHFKGLALYTEEENIRPLEEDEFYIHDLIDAEVFSTDHQFLGRIVNYFEAGPQGVCEVKSEDDTFLFPTSHEVLIEVIPSKKVVINLLPELRDLNKKKPA